MKSESNKIKVLFEKIKKNGAFISILFLNAALVMLSIKIAKQDHFDFICLLYIFTFAFIAFFMKYSTTEDVKQKKQQTIIYITIALSVLILVISCAYVIINKGIWSFLFSEINQ